LEPIPQLRNYPYLEGVCAPRNERQTVNPPSNRSWGLIDMG
jgi:hypothetical protein